MMGGGRMTYEFDAAGEYFLRDNLANAMPGLLAGQLERAMHPKAPTTGVEAGPAKLPIQGICVRVDREEQA